MSISTLTLTQLQKLVLKNTYGPRYPQLILLSKLDYAKYWEMLAPEFRRGGSWRGFMYLEFSHIPVICTDFAQTGKPMVAFF